MSLGADSFNATGGTVVTFETTSVPQALQQFGVSVVGTTCGVYGQGTAGHQKDRRTAPTGTGVFGSGDRQGVYGDSGGMGVRADVSGGTGVTVKASLSGSPAYRKSRELSSRLRPALASTVSAALSKPLECWVKIQTPGVEQGFAVKAFLLGSSENLVVV